jgi:hypothetical protein
MVLSIKNWNKGDRKIKKRFAFLPSLLAIGKERRLVWVWLQFYWSDMMYVDEVRFTHTTGYTVSWESVEDFLEKP